MGEAKLKREKRKAEAKKKGVFSEYLGRRMSPQGIEAERKKQLARISTIRDRAVMVFASDFRKGGKAPISISYEDILPFKDQVEVLEGESVDVILESPGGSAEVVEDLVRLLRDRFDSVAFIVPGWAKSAGTIMVMGGDEILMGPASALGPIDAQIQWKDKVFSAEAFLEGLKEMKREASASEEGLNRAHIPILQQISPGEIQHAQNALDFAKRLVADWLKNYKFRNWTEDSSSGKPVTHEEREEVATMIATELCKHQRWLSHGRSIKIDDLRSLGLKIRDYSEDEDLYDAVRRYHTLLQMAFESNIYKLFETPESLVVRFHNVQPKQVPISPQLVKKELAGAKTIEAEVPCPLCGHEIPLQLKLEAGVPDTSGRIPYPAGDNLPCPSCGKDVNLAAARREIERQIGRKVIA